MKIDFQYEELLFLLGVFLLLPWLILAPLSGMAFDAGPGFTTYLFVLSVWTYPLAVGIVWKFRERAPLTALVPCLNIAMCVLSSKPT